MKKNGFLFIFFYSVVLLTGCKFNTTNDIIIRRNIISRKIGSRESRKFEPDENVAKFVRSIDRIIEIDAKPTLIFSQGRKLFFLDTVSMEIYHSFELPYRISGFHFYSKDSILIATSNTEFTNGFTDSTLFLCNQKGEIYKYYPVKDSLLWSSMAKYSSENSYFTYMGLSHNMYMIDQYKIFMPLKFAYLDKRPIIPAFFDIKKEKLVIKKDIKLPYFPPDTIYYLSQVLL